MPLPQLSGLDASFLFLETPEMPMHVGAMHLLELPEGYRGSFVRDLRRLYAARMPAMPALRRRVWWMPLNLANPVWVDAEPDLAHHIVLHRLPRRAAGSPQRDARTLLEEKISLLHPPLLDRNKPLWRMHVIEGLPKSASGRKQVGVYSQLHHAAVDGQAAVALGNVIFDLTPEPRALQLQPSTRRKVFKVGMVEMLRSALTSEVAQVARVVRAVPGAIGTVAGTANAIFARRTLPGKGSGNVTLAPATPMNVSVGAARAFASASLPLPELKLLARAHGASLNDMVLMLCSGALRSYLLQRGCLPRKSLVAAVPVSLRQPGDTRSDTQASMSLVSLGTHLADPAQRLAHIANASHAMKSTMGHMKNISPTDFPTIGVPWLMSAAAALAGKLKIADRLPQLANVVISNVPGPQVPLYLAGARMLSNCPTSIVVHGLALNITVQSFDDHMDFGLMADKTALPDVKTLAIALDAALQELRELPAPPVARSATASLPAAKPKPPARKRASPASTKVTQKLSPKRLDSRVSAPKTRSRSA